MRLFIAEKPSVAKALADELGGPQRNDGYIVCDNATVTWCIGHLLENAEPDEYLSDDIPVTGKGTKVWRAQDLPIIPSEWILKPKKETKKQLNAIGKLLKRKDITEIVNAGDPDREGSLLVDQVLEHFNCNKPCLRFWVSAQDSTSLQRGLKNLKPNSQFKGWSDAAKARGNADWLIGMNLSRAYTLAADRGGNRALLVVGRVQTPTLNLVVERDRQIESFVPLPFFKIEAVLDHANGKYLAHWKNTTDRDGVDAEGRILDKAVASNIAAKVKNEDGSVDSYVSDKKKQAAPVPFSLADLTMLASKVHGMTADAVLKAAQSLYEKHKLTSYPRTDTGYLPESQHGDADTVLVSVRANLPSVENLIENADTSIKSRAFNDKKVTAHHGIIPTAQRTPKSALNGDETLIYEMVVRRYVAQFYPPYEYQDTRIEASIQNERFVATGKVTISPGWRSVLAGGGDKQETELPIVAVGDAVKATSVTIKDAKTSPPKSYTEGTLIYAMENIHRLYTGSKDDKANLRETDGIGTSATRAGIITELKRRKYLIPKGKSIVSTEHGRSVIDAYPDSIKSAHITAMNERLLKAIEQTGEGLQEFMANQESLVRDHVAKVNSTSINVKGAPEKANKKKKSSKKKATKVTSKYPCGACGAGLVLRKARVKGTSFWGCSAYPGCKTTYSDKAGKPAI